MKNEIKHGIDSDTANSDIAGMENGAPLIKKSGMLSRGLKLVGQRVWQIIVGLFCVAIGLLLITLVLFVSVGLGAFRELIDIVDIALEIVAGKRASYFLVVIATGGVISLWLIIWLRFRER
ncbi:MAG: hypothetical protein CRN43_17175 [Candidatus Nephrothrix sp. EaCA]|nr:MAG: hypothetical protein CRN43_17175 [Candidatus Nephrothrix sp. EaCA]